MQRVNNMKAIETKGLTKFYGKARGITGLNLAVEEGEFFGFIGPNGAGKSTTIRILTGLIKSSGGSASIFGKDVSGKKDELLEDIGYLPSEAVFYNGMKVEDVIKLSADLRKRDCSADAARLCDRLQLDTDKKVEELSFGNRKKVGIVCALQHNPKLCILDEPTSGLDPLMQNRFIELVEEERKRKKTILMSSHMFEEVERTCHRIGIIRAGKLVALDSVESLRERYVRPYTVTLDTPELAEAFAKDFGGACEGNRVTVTTKQSLEEIFMHYYGGDGNDQ